MRSEQKKKHHIRSKGDGAWSIHHLSQELQRIVSDHQSHFFGEPVVVSSLPEEVREQGAYV